MRVSIDRKFGMLWVIITPSKDWFDFDHLYVDQSWTFETLGM